MTFANVVSGDLISVHVTALRTVYMVAVDHPAVLLVILRVGRIVAEMVVSG